MKIVKQNETNEFKNSDACIAVEYPLDDPDINGAVIRLNGRYPDTGYAMNKSCKEIAYIIEGQGQLFTDTDSRVIAPGDLALILPGEKYYFEGALTMFMPCTPAWRPDQHELIAK